MKLFKIILLISIMSYSFNMLSHVDPDCFVKTCISCKKICESENKCCDGDDIFGKTFFSMRPQDSNAARKLINFTNTRFFMDDELCFAVSAIVNYQKSFSKSDLAKWFSVNCEKCFTFGITDTNRGISGFDFNALQFGITNSSNVGQIAEVCMEPEVENIIADFGFRFDPCFCENLWLGVNFIVARAKTNLNLCITETTSAKSTFTNGLFTFDCTSTTTSLSCVLEALGKNSAFGDIPALHCGLFSNKDLKKTGLAGIHLDLGYDLVRRCNSYFGFSLHGVIPTGTRPKGKYIFEPVVGANKSGQVGATMYGGFMYNEFDCPDNAGIFFDLTFTHLFKARQTRLLALKDNGPGSQYLLVKRFIGPLDDSQLIGADRLANILCAQMRIGADLMFDGAVMFMFRYCDFTFNIGYNLWARTKEKIDKSDICLRNFVDEGYGIKGDLPLSEPETILSTIVCVDNTQTASKSTIGQSSAADSDTVFIKASDIDFSVALHPSAVSHKFFASIGYSRNCFACPVDLTVAGEVEFSANNKAVNQWGVMFAIGIGL